MSYFEIYLDKIRDLLDGEWAGGSVEGREEKDHSVLGPLGLGTVG